MNNQNLNKQYEVFIHSNHYKQFQQKIEANQNENTSFICFSDFNLDDSNVVYLSNDSSEQQLHDALVGIQNQSLLAIDCEWQPNFIKEQLNDCSILQIGTLRNVYLFDLQADKIRKSAEFKKTLLAVFGSPSIAICGQEIHHDLPYLQSMLSHDDDKHECQEQQQDIVLNNYYDIKQIFKKLYPNDSFKSNLSHICSLVLFQGEKCLDKRLALSNWGQRPLTNNQIQYAALDAYVCIRLFTKFQDVFLQRNNSSESFGSLCLNDAINNRNKQTEDNKRLRNLKNRKKLIERQKNQFVQLQNMDGSIETVSKQTLKRRLLRKKQALKKIASQNCNASYEESLTLTIYKYNIASQQLAVIDSES